MLHYWAKVARKKDKDGDLIHDDFWFRRINSLVMLKKDFAKIAELAGNNTVPIWEHIVLPGDPNCMLCVEDGIPTCRVEQYYHHSDNPEIYYKSVRDMPEEQRGTFSQMIVNCDCVKQYKLYHWPCTYAVLDVEQAAEAA